MCREKLKMEFNEKPILGSPLRVQGKVIVVENLAFKCRITPACAGKR